MWPMELVSLFYGATELSAAPQQVLLPLNSVSLTP